MLFKLLLTQGYNRSPVLKYLGMNVVGMYVGIHRLVRIQATLIQSAGLE